MPCLLCGMRSPVKSLTWQQAAKDYAAKCNGEVHLFDEGHMMYAFIPDKLASMFSDFLEKTL